MASSVVTIARQLGCGGDEVAAQVAERLGVPLLDQEIISRAAQTAGVSEQALISAERSSSLLSRMLENLGKFGAAGAEGTTVEGVSSTTLLTTSADFRVLLQQALRDVASSGPAVIVGHAGQVVLRDQPDTLHVFIHAPMEYRVARYARAEGISPQKARSQLEESDRERVRFYRNAYHVDYYDLRLYDLVIDTQLVGGKGAVELIAEMAERCDASAEEIPASIRPVEVSAPATAGNGAPSRSADGLRIRPMTPSDAGALLALFRSLPPGDLLFLRRDVTDELVVDAWARDVADGKMITMLAETADGVIVGESSLRPSEVPWTRHVGEVRVVISPDVRGQGVGRSLLREVMESAKAAGIEKLTAEMIVEQGSARRLFEGMGFREEGRFRAYARDQSGRTHDLLVMTYTGLE